MAPGVVISCFARLGGIGISNVLFHTARAAWRAGVLDAVLCYGNRQDEIPRTFVRPVRFQPAKPLSFLKARYYYTLKRMTLDRAARRYVRRRGCRIFHGWTTECVLSFGEARRIGAKTVLERPAPHSAVSRRLLREEYDRWGVPFPMEGGISWLRRIDWGYREETVAPREYELADRIVVQSEFGARSFAGEGFPPERLVVLPRAVDLAEYAPPRERPRGPFRALFVGAACIRKGILDLLAAWKELSLPDAELWIVGQVMDEVAPRLAPYRDDPTVRFFGHVKGGAARFYAEATAFVLPSIVEGSAKTTYEAMAAGLPVITTENAGSVVRDGADGFIVPIRDPGAIADRLLRLYRDGDAARAMGASGRARVAGFSWDAYESRLARLYAELAAGGAA